MSISTTELELSRDAIRAMIAAELSNDPSRSDREIGGR